jgi:hypothetical protein
MDENDYKNEPDEKIWDHAHRIITLCLIKEVVEAGTLHEETAILASQPIGAYINGFEHMKNSLMFLYFSRERLHREIKWARRSDGALVSQLITSDDKEELAIFLNANLSFKEYVKSWQPLFDALAELICLALEWKGVALVNQSITMTKLAKAASIHEWPIKLTHLKAALTDRIDWYTNDVRIKRNQFVHNQREVSLLPDPESEKTIVEVCKFDHPEVQDQFYLDNFINWTLGKYLLFAVEIAEGMKELRDYES